MIPINRETCLLNRLHMVTISKRILESACLASKIGFSDVCYSDRFHYTLCLTYFGVNSCFLITNGLSLYKKTLSSNNVSKKSTSRADRQTDKQLDNSANDSMFPHFMGVGGNFKTNSS